MNLTGLHRFFDNLIIGGISRFRRPYSSMLLGGFSSASAARSSLATTVRHMNRNHLVNDAPKVRKSFPETWLWNDISSELSRFVLTSFNKHTRNCAANYHQNYDCFAFIRVEFLLIFLHFKLIYC